MKPLIHGVGDPAALHVPLHLCVPDEVSVPHENGSGPHCLLKRAAYDPSAAAAFNVITSSGDTAHPAIVRTGRLTKRQRLDGGPKDGAGEGVSIGASERGRDGPEREDREDEGEGGHHVGTLLGQDFGVGSEERIDVQPQSPIRWKDVGRKWASRPILFEAETSACQPESRHQLIDA